MDPGRDPRLTAEWNAVLRGLGVVPDGPLLLGGRNVDFLGQALGVAVAAGSRDITVIGSGADIDVDAAVPNRTGAPTGAFPSVVMLEAWSDSSGIPDVAREATRVARAGGTVWLGELDVGRLLESTTGQYRSALLYSLHPEIAEMIRQRHRGAAILDVEAVRSGLKSVEAIDLDLPVAVLDSPDTYAEAVRSGMWRGVRDLRRDELEVVLAELADLLRRSPPPFVEREPWHLVRGTKRG